MKSIKFNFRRVHLSRPRPTRLQCTGNLVSVGVDLGTTNSAVAAVMAGKAKVIRSSEGLNSTPSVVSYSATGPPTVGAAAKRRASENAENTYYSVKRILGRSFDDVTSEQRRLGYELQRGVQGEVLLRYKDTTIRPETISAQVVAYLLDCVKRECEVDEIRRCVISVPAYFTEAQRSATIAAVTSFLNLFLELILNPYRSREWSGASASDPRASGVSLGLWLGPEPRSDGLCV